MSNSSTSAETLPTDSFPPGTFSPAPQRAPAHKILAAQTAVEAKLLLRHGEQQLLNIIIPLFMLIAASVLPLLGEDTGINEIFPMILAIAATSAGFTGQAISLVFDRRYGALKRSGASGVPTWAIISAKICAVAIMMLIQVLILGSTALFLGWRTDAIGIVFGLLTLFIGVAIFTAMGLLMGGTLSPETVLGLANLVWLLLVAVVGWVVFAPGLADAGWYNLIPSVALASSLTLAFEGSVPYLQLLILVVWGVVASAAAIKWFRFQ